MLPCGGRVCVCLRLGDVFSIFPHFHLNAFHPPGNNYYLSCLWTQEEMNHKVDQEMIRIWSNQVPSGQKPSDSWCSNMISERHADSSSFRDMLLRSCFDGIIVSNSWTGNPTSNWSTFQRAYLPHESWPLICFERNCSYYKNPSQSLGE